MLIISGVLTNADGLKEDEENFTEAIAHVNTALLPTKVKSLLFMKMICYNEAFTFFSIFWKKI